MKAVLAIPDDGGPRRGKPSYFIRTRWRDDARAIITCGCLYGSRHTWVWRVVFNEHDDVLEAELVKSYDGHWRYRYKEVLKRWTDELRAQEE